jgi:TonB-linked SusC/RagA family outer membrane protein
MQKHALCTWSAVARHPDITKTVLVMKLTILLLTVTCLQVTARVNSQEVNFRGDNVPLTKVFDVVKKQTGYLFFYTGEMLREANPVTIHAKGLPLKEFLQLVFQHQPLEFTIEDNGIIVSKKAVGAKPADISSSYFTPPIDVKGRIVNEKGEPVVGATVKVKGKNIGAISDDKGEFILNDIEVNAILQITAVNIEGFEWNVNGKAELILTAKMKISQEEEVQIISTGYQEIPKERATGSFVNINNQLFNRRVGASVIDRLEGITSGLVFNPNYSKSSSQFVQESPYTIRGASTIFGDAQPLIVVDNFPYDGDINNINPNDVASITVLKDAAAASIWGVRAGNGVIVITTKRGKINQAIQVDLNSNMTISDKPDLFYDRNFLSSSDFIDVEKILFDRGFYDDDIANTQGNFVPVSPVVDLLNRARSGLISESEAASRINSFRTNDVRDDISKFFYRRSINQQYSINIRGGNEKSSYYFSTGFDKMRGAQVGNENNRITINAANSYKPVKNFEISTGINYVQNFSKVDFALSQISSDGGGLSRKIYPYAKFEDAQGNHLPIVKGYSEKIIENAEANNFLNWQYVPLDEIGRNGQTGKTMDIRLLGNIKYNFPFGISAEVKYQYEKQFISSQNLANEQSYYARDLINKYSILSSGQVVNYNIPIGGILKTSSSDLISHNARAQLNYTHSSRGSDIIAIVGVDIREVNVSTVENGEIYGYNEDNATSQVVNIGTPFGTNPYGFASVPFTQQIGGTTDRFRSWFGNASYTMNSKYVFSASGRIDQSNLFGVNANQRSVPLWSTGVKWKLDQESFYHISWLPVLNLRATYGYNGNLNKSVTAFTTARYQAYTDFSGRPYTVAQVNSLGNPDLRWEKISMLNLGIDFSLKQNIINGSIEYYQKNGTDLFGDAFLPSSTGYTSLRGNFASIKGRGVDLTINTINVNRAIRWETNFLATYTKDKISKYTGTTPGIALVEGRPISSIYSLPWAGLDSIGEPQGYLNKEVSKDFATISALPFAKQVFNGPKFPSYFGSIRNTFTLRGFSISANISYKLGYYFRRNSIVYSSLFNSWMGNMDFTNRWQNPGDELKTIVPALPSTTNPDWTNFYSNSEVLIEKADHIRLQDVSLQYTFIRSFGKSRHRTQIQLYSYINNLGILWRANKQHIDPDYQVGYPSPKSIAFGFKASF